MLLSIEEKSMQLEVEEVVEAIADLPTPVEEEAVEDVRLQNDRQKAIANGQR